MNELIIIKSDKFSEVVCDVYSNNNDDYFMTIDQLSEVLGYASKDGVEKILARNEYLKNGEFSSTYRLSVVEGGRTVSRERILFSEDGIYEVSMLSQTEKGREFRKWIRSVVKSIRKTGKYEITQKYNQLSQQLKNTIDQKLYDIITDKNKTIEQAEDEVNREIERIRHAAFTKIMVLPRLKNNKLSKFIDDLCEIGDDYAVDLTLLYGAYFTWCLNSDQKPVSKLRFANIIAEYDEIAYLKSDYKHGLNARFVGVKLVEVME